MHVFHAESHTELQRMYIHHLYYYTYVGRQSAAIKLQHQAAEKYNFKCRLKEEEVLLLKEMKSLLCFYNKQIESLTQEISGMSTNITV